MSRAVAADILKISISELRRRENDRIYPFVVDERGTHWYDETTLRQAAGIPVDRLAEDKSAAKKKTGKSLPSSFGRGYSKEDAAIVFRELEKNKPLSVIVQELEIHPETVMAIAEVYGRVTGSVFVSKALVDKMGTFPLRGQWPPRNEVELVSVLEATLSQSKCSRCTRPARFCATCVATMSDPVVKGPVANGSGANGANSLR